MAVWPAALKINRENYSETPPNNVVRTETEYGPAKLRKRTSSNVRKAQASLFLTDAEVDTLDEFYLENDALAFSFTNPRTSVVEQARFVSPPEYSLRETMWGVSLSLEILP